MEGKKSLRIGLEELCSAMEDSSYEHEYYLDLKTGEIVFLSDIDGEETDELRDGIDEEPGRFEQIPKAGSHEMLAFQVMAEVMGFYQSLGEF